MLRDTTPSAQAMTSKKTNTSTILANNSSSVTIGSSSGRGSSSSSISSSIKDLFRCFESFRTLNIGVPKSNSTEKNWHGCALKLLVMV
ncbi:unnamed protein product [Dovyalis caffra]|uniref:Uncharacterized protein n=1 Tax=Dovyalis caffra TaxID=77055 RepID=A0AAV1SNM2_9ROSI|nr:unnamed protein product [Dovyalis caffra]